ncbi:MAG: hypothetical protein KatS3mg087_1821 [Patescibacteria group bacterium]|nr:MAG: hypothetical protein KatS3mg087_1821 [Patescibacteria group bacterium]
MNTIIVVALWFLHLSINLQIVELYDDVHLTVTATPSGEECRVYADYTEIGDHEVTIYFDTNCSVPYWPDTPMYLYSTINPHRYGLWCVNVSMYDAIQDRECFLVVPRVYDLFLPSISR